MAVEKAKIEIEWLMTVEEHTKISVVKGVVTEWESAPKLNVAYEQPTRFSAYEAWNDPYDRALYRRRTAGDDSGGSCAVAPDMKLGWNLHEGQWKWFDGTTARLEVDDDPAEGTVIMVGSKRIATFMEFLDLYTYDALSDGYYTENGTYLGDEETLWDMYEMQRYEQYWDNEAINRY
jgi:hypothetical protein